MNFKNRKQQAAVMARIKARKGLTKGQYIVTYRIGRKLDGLRHPVTKVEAKRILKAQKKSLKGVPDSDAYIQRVEVIKQ